MMRTTVTLDDRLLSEAKVLAASTSRTVSSILEEALRDLLGRQAHANRDRVPVRLPTDGWGGLQPGVDLLDREQMAQLLGENTLRL